jgi:hypothetical protein
MGATARTDLMGERQLSLEREWCSPSPVLRLPSPVPGRSRSDPSHLPSDAQLPSIQGDQLLTDNKPRGEKFRKLITLPEFESILYTL